MSWGPYSWFSALRFNFQYTDSYAPCPPLTHLYYQNHVDPNGSSDVAMDKSCADYWFKSFEDFKADGGKVDGIVEWISDPDAAKQVRLDISHLSPLLCSN